MMIVLKLKTVNGLRCSLIFITSFLIIYVSITQLSKASLYGIFNIFTVDFNNDLYKNSPEIIDLNLTNENYFLLEDFSTKEYELINSQLKIFFIQTSENEDILSRHACSIESAARLHSNGLIFVFMRSKYIHRKKGSFNYLQTYINIRFVHFNEQDIYSGTTLSRLNETKRTQFIHYFTISHMSDFIRTALLYKYGGIYFDLDVIPLKTFNLFLNTVALESIDGVNVAVLAFEKQHLVLDIQMDIQLTSVNKKFHGLCWNCFGPSALSDALKRICDEQKLHINSKDRCQQIDIQPSFVFYPIPYQQIPQFFRYSKSSLNDMNYLIQNSSIYSIHYFHHMTMNLPIENLSPFARIAKIYCPNIYEQNEFNLIKQTTNTSKKYFFTNFNIIFLCLIITFLSILILLLVWIFLTYLTSIRIVILTIQHKLNLD